MCIKAWRLQARLFTVATHCRSIKEAIPGKVKKATDEAVVCGPQGHPPPDGSVIRFDRNAPADQQSVEPRPLFGPCRANCRQNHMIISLRGVLMAAKIGKAKVIVLTPRQGPHRRGVPSASRHNNAGPRVNLVKRHQKQTRRRGRHHLEGVASTVQHRISAGRQADRVGFKIQADGKKGTHRQTLGTEIDG